MPDLLIDLPAVIQKELSRRDVTQRQLAEQINVLPSTINRLMRGHGMCDVPTFVRLCAWLEMAPADFATDVADDLGERMRRRSLGAYRLFWKSGGSSVAVVGQLYNGRRWYACANWTTGSVDADRAPLIGTDWSQIERAEEISTGGEEDDGRVNSR